MLGGGINLSNSSGRTYLIGSSAPTGTGIEDLSTNTSCFMDSGKLYSNNKAVITESDTNRIIGTYSANSKGFITLAGIKINWGSFSISANSKGSSNFASAFRGSPYSAVCTWDYDNTGSQENYAITSVTSTTIFITNGEGTTRLFRWIAIGPA